MPGKQRKAVINSQTSGRFRFKTTGGREHIITQMVPIVGDTVMNSIYYPDIEVAASFQQLDNLPAPNGHPLIEGRSVSAFHPMAVNAFNIGGFIKAPVKKGKRVTNELWVDVEIANTTDDGKEVIRRIKEGDKLGVSTGLNLTLIAQNGTGEDGHEYTAIGKEYQFDHVALLLNEISAGDHVGTELVTNDGAKLVVGIVENTTVSDLMESINQALQKQFASGDTRVWLRDFIIEDNLAVYEVFDEEAGKGTLFTVGIRRVDDDVVVEGMPMPVEEKTSFIPLMNAEDSMRWEITENGSALSSMLRKAVDKKTTDDKSRADVVKEMATAAGIEPGTVNGILSGDIDKPPEARLKAFAKVLGVSFDSLKKAAGTATNHTEEDEMEITRENATAHLETLGLVVIDPKSAEAVANAEALATFAENKDAFEAYQAKQAEALNAKRAECVEATGLTTEQVENMDIETMSTLITNAKKVVNNGLRLGGVAPTDEQKAEAKGTASTFVRGVTAE